LDYQVRPFLLFDIGAVLTIFEKLILEGEIPMKKIISILMITLFLGGTFLIATGCYTPPEGSRRNNDDGHSSSGHSH